RRQELEVGHSRVKALGPQRGVALGSGECGRHAPPAVLDRLVERFARWPFEPILHVPNLLRDRGDDSHDRRSSVSPLDVPHSFVQLFLEIRDVLNLTGGHVDRVALRGRFPRVDATASGAAAPPACDRRRARPRTRSRGDRRLGAQRPTRGAIALRTHYRALLRLEYSGLEDPASRPNAVWADGDRRTSGSPRADHWRDEIVEWRLQLEKILTRSIMAKLDLPGCYRTAIRLVRCLERDVPGLISRLPGGVPLHARTDRRCRRRGLVPATPHPSCLSRRPSARSCADAGNRIRLVQSFALTQQGGGGSLDPLLELGHQQAAWPAGGYRFEEFENDPAGPLDKASPPPEKPGIDRGRNQRHGQCLVERGDPRLIGKTCAWGNPRPLREDDDRPTLGSNWSGCCNHAAQRAGAGLAVDPDRAGTRGVPAVERQ